MGKFEIRASENATRWRGTPRNLAAAFVAGVVAYGLASASAPRPQLPASWVLREAAERGRVAELEAASAEQLGRMDGFGVTPLLAAARCGQVGAVEAILRRGVDVNARVPIHGTALAAAATFGCADVVRVLLAHGADVRARSEYGRDALMAAAVGGDAACVRMLLAAGADPRNVDRKGWSARRHAADAGNPECARILAEAVASDACTRGDGPPAR